MSNSALLIVDLQNDFIDGTLAVPGAKEIISKINELMSRKNWDFIVGSKDWHPSNHVSFAETHGKTPFTQISISEKNQMLWPVHCVQGTVGAEITPFLQKEKVETWVLKGTNVHRDAYSAFEATSHQFSSLLKEHKISRVYVCGLATDYCVKASALDAVLNGFETVVVRDCIKGVDETTSQSALREMTLCGVKLVDMIDI